MSNAPQPQDPWPQPAAQPYPPQPQYAMPAAPSTNGLAVASMVLGIIWIYWIGSILALIFGYVAKKQIQESHGRQRGSGMATAGIVLGWVGVGILSIIVVTITIGSATGI